VLLRGSTLSWPAGCQARLWALGRRRSVTGHFLITIDSEVRYYKVPACT